MAIKFRKKNGNAINLSSVDKPLRKALREKQKEIDTEIISNFSRAISGNNATRQDVADALKVNGSPTFLSVLTAKIKYTDKGAIDRRSLPLPLRSAYKDVETTKQAQFELSVKKKFAEAKNLSIDEITKMNEMSKKMKTPFNGKFGEEKKNNTPSA